MNRFLLIIGIAISVLTLIFNVVIFYQYTPGLSQWINEKDALLLDLSQFRQYISELKDAETGQRGYIITGNNSYLEPYNKSLSFISSTETQDFLAKNEQQKAFSTAVKQLRKLTNNKIDELQDVIKKYKEDGFSAAQRQVSSNIGKNVMDQIRTLVDNILFEKQKSLDDLEKKTYSNLNFIIKLVVSINILYVLLICICLTIFYLESKKIHR